jgi:hypothetical protein
MGDLAVGSFRHYLGPTVGVVQGGPEWREYSSDSPLRSCVGKKIWCKEEGERKTVVICDNLRQMCSMVVVDKHLSATRDQRVKESKLVAEALEVSKSVLGFLDEGQRGGWRYPDEVKPTVEVDVAL